MAIGFFKLLPLFLFILILLKFDLSDLIATFSATLSAIGTFLISSLMYFTKDITPAVQSIINIVCSVIAISAAAFAGFLAAICAIITNLAYIIKELIELLISIRVPLEIGYKIFLRNITLFVAKITSLLSESISTFIALSNYSVKILHYISAGTKVFLILLADCIFHFLIFVVTAFVHLLGCVKYFDYFLTCAYAAIVNSLQLATTAYYATFNAVKTAFSIVLRDNIHGF